MLHTMKKNPKFASVAVLLAIFMLPFSANALDTTTQENTCAEIGFKRKTEAHANCVLELLDRQKSKMPVSPDDAACKKYGFKKGTSDYSTCLMRIDQARQQAQQQYAMQEEQTRQYEEQLAMYKKEQKRKAAEKSLDMSLRMLNGMTPTDALLTAGTGAPIRPLNQPPAITTIQMPNGKVMNCEVTNGRTFCF